MSTVEIERYKGARCLSPAIPATGQSRRTRAQSGLALHVHDCHELCFVSDGIVEWVVDGREVDVAPNQVFLTRPGELHGSRSRVFNPCVLSWIQIDSAKIEDNHLRTSFEAISLPVWDNCSRGLRAHLCAIHEELRSPRDDSSAVVSAQLTLLLTNLVRSYREYQSTPRVKLSGAPHKGSALVENLSAFIEQNLQRHVSVSELVSRSGYSRARLHELFKKSYGMSPSRFIAHQRLARARTLLLTSNRSVTDISIELGYSSSQHFASAFRRGYGAAPTAYRRAARAG